jgi:endo-1,4-beta-mannosidase
MAREVDGSSFVVGVNYWPRRKAMGWWRHFDPGEVRDEFGLIRELGLGVVRIFLLWDDFQPEPDRVSADALGHLVEVADIAAGFGLSLVPTFFTGHMSGTNWAPRWLLDESMPRPGGLPVVSRGRTTRAGYRNPYADPEAMRAQVLLATTVVGALRDHPATWLWDLGNEPDVFALPPDDHAAPAWAGTLTDAIHEVDDRHPITTGLHGGNLVVDNGVRVDRLFGSADLATTHPYSIYADWAQGPLDPDFAAFCAAMTGALSGRRVLVEEFGICMAAPGRGSHIVTGPGGGSQFMASEDDAAAYVRAVLPRVVEVGALGALIWCFADYDRSLWRRPPCRDAPHERFFGLVRPDGSLKPHALALRDFAATQPVVRPVPARARLAVDPDEFYRDPMSHLRRLYAEFRATP